MQAARILYAGAVTPSEGENGAADSLAQAMNATPAQTQPDAPSGGVIGGVSAGPAAPPVSRIVTAPGTQTAATAVDSGTKRTLAQRALDRVPVKWLGTAGTVVFLAATAAFGGLAAVPEPEPPAVEVGQTFIGSELEITPVRATVIDRLRGSGVFPQPGERVLTVVMDVRNLSEFARLSATDGALRDVRLEGFEAVDASIARLDDGLIAPWLQPGVAARVVLSWAVPAGMVSEGDDVRMLLPDSTRSMGQFVLHGVVWSDATVGGILTIPVEDLGTGEESA